MAEMLEDQSGRLQLFGAFQKPLQNVRCKPLNPRDGNQGDLPFRNQLFFDCVWPSCP
jgi:hypothetical protein